MLLSCHHYSSTEGWNTPLRGELDSENTLLLVFGPSDITPVAPGLTELRATFPQAIWVGCSTAGEVFGSVITDESLSVAIARFERARLKLATQPIAKPAASWQAGQSVAQALSAPDLQAVFVLSDGLAVNGSELIQGLSTHLPPKVTITGGLAGDGSRFTQTWVMTGRHPKEKHLAAIGFYGEHVHIAHGSQGGWDMLGPEREVTRSQGNILYTLDDQPALSLYKKYLGNRAAGLPATGLLFPLAIRNDEASDGLSVRTIYAVDEATNSITLASDLPQGTKVRLMRATLERLVDGASDSAKALDLNDYRNGPLLGIAISCVGRRLVLGQRTEEELEAVLAELPPQAELVGFYSYGEISPLASGRCALHNQTMTLTGIWED